MFSGLLFEVKKRNPRKERGGGGCHGGLRAPKLQSRR